MSKINQHDFLVKLDVILHDSKQPSSEALSQRVVALFEQNVPLQQQERTPISQELSRHPPSFTHPSSLEESYLKQYPQIMTLVTQYFPLFDEPQLMQKLRELQLLIEKTVPHDLDQFGKEIQALHAEWKKTSPGLGIAVLELLFDSSYSEEKTDALCKVIGKSLTLFPPQNKETHSSPLSQKILIEIAKVAAAQNGWGTSQYIQNHGITDEKALIDIAKIAAAQSGEGISQYIQNYGITDKKTLIDIAMIAAAQNGWGTSRCIQNYGITDQKVLIDIAKIAAAQNGEGTSKYIQKYGITDKKTLIEIAKIAAAKSGWGISRYIQNYGITDKKALIDIAKIAAAESGKGTSQYIQNYGITDQKTLIEIAKIAAAQDGEGTSQYIQNYGITDEKVLIDIAKIAAAKSGWGTSEYIQNYGITDQKTLIEIAKIAAAQDGEGTSQYIQNYGITDEKVLIDIAKIAAAQDGEGTSQYIQNYGITDQKTLIEIAMIAAAQHGWGTSQYIKNYGITDQKALIDIAKIAVDQDGKGTSISIKYYGITDPHALFGIFLAALANTSQTLRSMNSYAFERFPPQDFSMLLPAFQELKKDSFDLQSIRLSLAAFDSVKAEQLQPLFDQISTEQDPRIQKTLTVWLIHFVAKCQEQKLSPEQFNALVRYKFIQNTLAYRVPSFRYGLTDTMIAFAKSQDAQKFVDSSPPHKEQAKIPLLFLSLLYAQGISERTCQALLSQADQRLFKDNNKLKVYVQTLHAILKEKELPAQDKDYLLSLLPKLPDFFHSLYIILAILELKGAALLQQSSLERSDYSLSKILQDLFQQLLPIKEIPNFSQQYVKHFVEARLPHYICTYIAKIQSLPFSERETLLKNLSSCVEGMLEETLGETRYALSESTHLQTVFTDREDLLAKWKKGDRVPLQTFLTGSNTSQKIDFKKILYEKIVTDHHFDPDTLPYLRDCLTNARSTSELLREMTSLKPTDELEVQLAGIQLTEETLSLPKQKALLHQILKGLQKLPQSAEFINDIKALLKGLEPQKQKYDKWTLVDTDDPQDLFLCGTEMESCQRITGAVAYNKCLLAYVIDGKNRLIAIKDKEGKIIARHLFRILWDGKQPVLFLERLYPAVLSPELQQAIQGFALARAKALELPLLSLEEGGSLYPASLLSLGSPAPYEYSDAGHGVTRGVFTIENARFLIKT